MFFRKIAVFFAATLAVTLCLSVSTFAAVTPNDDLSVSSISDALDQTFNDNSELGSDLASEAVDSETDADSSASEEISDFARAHAMLAAMLFCTLILFVVLGATSSGNGDTRR